ncbi:hypothetical protein [Paenibacillus flagellatus]|uniref:Lipoprotein n=1 Tax=Paenibacillus flagellatus TaxID=2211139 RepID=A0A2V5KJ31_9BACL|nr:hypothetical protein [Paenibacillus flagellatus]PYI54600.1 hypothetical protein DLM86_14180 [Paenibacillus flagellatus]
MNKKRLLVVPALLTAAALLFGGCSDGTKQKEAVRQAIRKQAEVGQYRFAGSLSVEWEAAADSAAKPLAAGLLNALNGAAVEFAGAASRDPVRLEATFKMTPKSGASVSVPILIKDNKMYAQFPLVNKPDEYIAFDLANPAAAPAAGPLSPEALGRSNEAMAGMLDKLLADIDPKWFAETKSGDGGTAVTYAVDITDRNAQELSALLRTKAPEWAGMLRDAGLLAQAKADAAAKSAGGAELRLKAPGSIRITVGEKQFVERIALDVSGETAVSAGTPRGFRMKLDYALSGINEPPAFEKDVPAKTKPFEDLLKGLPKK